MSEFSKLLDKYIERSRLTEAQLARDIGFSRSYIALFRSGQRVPADEEKMQVLLKRLNLMLFEQEVLWELYLQERYGAGNYLAMKKLYEILQMVGNPTVSACKSSYRCVDMKMAKAITGRIDVENHIKAVLSTEVTKHGPIKIFMADPLVFEWLSPCQFQDIEIEHIICMRTDDMEGFENIATLGNILKTKISGLPGYVAWYFNLGNAHQCIEWALVPYCIITDGYVITIAGDAGSAYISDDAVMNTIYRQQFERIKADCNILLGNMPETDHEIEETDIISIGWPLYLRQTNGRLNLAAILDRIERSSKMHTLYLTRSMIKKALNMLDKEAVGSLSESLRDGRVNVYVLSEKCSVSPDVFLTMYGLRRIVLGSGTNGPYVLEAQPLIQTICVLLEKLSLSSYAIKLTPDDCHSEGIL